MEAAGRKALSYVQELPDFVCIQTTKRFIRVPRRMSPTGALPEEHWNLEDQITEELTYNDHRESYKLLKADRHEGAFMSPDARRGSSSTGEYASILESLFRPASHARFQMEGIEKIKGRKTVRTKFRVEQANSDRDLKYLLEGTPMRSIQVAYGGRCWLDAATGQVVRLELEAVEIPPDFPIAQSSTVVEYGAVEIAGKRCWLPVRAETRLATSRSRDLPEHERLRDSRNVIEFRDYRRFGADVKIEYLAPK
jgi:hypothetical protein